MGEIAYLCPMIPSQNARSDLRTFWQAILIFLMLSIVVGCSDDDEAPVTAVLRPQVTVLFSPNALGDNGYNDRIYTGLVRARVSRDLNLEILVPNSNAEADSMLVEWLDAYTAGTTPRLLVFASDEYEALARRYAARLPQTAKDRTLLFESTATDLPVATFAMPAYGACYRAGLLTAIWDEQPRCIIVSANDYSLFLREARQAFADGFEKVWGLRPDSCALADDFSGYYMADSLQRMVEGWNGRYNLVFPIVGGSVSGLSNYLLTNFTIDLKVVGMDNYETYYYTPFYVVKHIDDVVRQCVEQWADGAELPRGARYGLASGRTEVVVEELWLTDEQRALVGPTLTEALQKESEYEQTAP